MDTTTTTINALPGELAPLEWTEGRGPITADEALGVARRLARKEIERGRPNSKTTIPGELPDYDAVRSSFLFRLPPRMMAFVRARADIEDRTVTSVVEELLTMWAYSTPNAPQQ